MIGPNGAGKTTLLRMLTGAAAAGLGHAQRSGRRCSWPMWTNRAPSSIPTRPLGGDLRRPGRDLRSETVRNRPAAPTSAASTSRAPASRRRSASFRAASAIAYISPSCCAPGGNLLLLDEPTNDLDTDTLRALEEALLAFAGCAIVVSHDRWFLDRVATHVLAFEGDSRGPLVRGQLRGLRAVGATSGSAPPPTGQRRITYKRLVRH